MNTRPVAIQGGPSSFSHQAARSLMGETVDCRFLGSFEAVVVEVQYGIAEFGLLPVKNSLIGPILGVAEYLSRPGLVHVSTVDIPIEHCLIALPGSCESQLSEVHSHPAALAQCRGFLAAHPALRPIDAEDTANSLAMIRARGQGHVAAIASREAAAFHQLPVLQEGIQDAPDNHTRFQLFRRDRRGGSHHQVQSTSRAKPV